MRNFNSFFKIFLIFRQKTPLFEHKIYYMNRQFNLEKYSKIHFIGVGGISVNSLAKFCILNGKKVSGSDNLCSKLITDLQKQGLTFYLGHHRESVKNTELVVYSSAIKEDNVELVEAKKRNIPVVKRSEFLGYIASLYKKCIAVSGSHGKTTATAMLSNVLILDGKDPTVFLGGEHAEYGNFRQGDDSTVILEACEYKKNFLDIPHTVSVLLNIDNDHQESYKNMNDVINTFGAFLGDSIGVINADDKYLGSVFNRTTVTFGIENTATFNAKRIRKKDGCYSFTVYAYNKRLGRINLKVLGRHNIYNALSTVATASLLGVDFNTIKRGIESFVGVKRRNENIGAIDGIYAVCDYAHHPREIEAQLKVIKDQKIKPLVIFQPHTYSRTKSLIDEFTSVLSKFDNLIVYKTYPARENFDYNGSAKRLYEEIKKVKANVLYADSEQELYELLRENCTKNKLNKLLFLGAGDIYDIANKMVISSNFRNKIK